MLLIFYLLMILYSYSLGDAKCRNHISDLVHIKRNMVHYKNIFLDKESVSQDEET